MRVDLPTESEAFGFFQRQGVDRSVFLSAVVCASRLKTILGTQRCMSLCMFECVRLKTSRADVNALAVSPPPPAAPSLLTPRVDCNNSITRGDCCIDSGLAGLRAAAFNVVAPTAAHIETYLLSGYKYALQDVNTTYEKLQHTSANHLASCWRCVALCDFASFTPLRLFASLHCIALHCTCTSTCHCIA